MSFSSALRDQQTGIAATTTPFGALRTAELTRLFGTNFEGSSLPANYWSTTLAGAGAIIVSGATVRLQPGTTANGRAYITGIKINRFLAGNANLYQTGLRVTDTGIVNNVRRWGLFNENNGFFFELSGTTFGVGYRKNGVRTFIPASSWSKVPNYVLNTQYHTYDIIYSAARTRFYIDFVLVHEVQSTTSTLVSIFNLPVSYENININNATANVFLDSRTVSVNRLGKALSRPLYQNVTGNTSGVLKTQAGTLHRVIINKKGSGGNVITLYDSTAASGTVIATIDTVNAPGGSFEYDLDFSNGLAFNMNTGNAADITIIFD